MFVIQGGEAALIRERQQREKKRWTIGAGGGCGPGWAVLVRGKRARPLLHPTCSAEKRCGFPGLVGLGKKGLYPDASRKKTWEPPLKERKHRKGELRPTPSAPGGFAASHEQLPWHRPPWQGVAARQLLLPFSHQQKWPHPSWHQCSRRAGARRRRATPERQDGLSLFSRVWAGSRLGWAGPPRPASL